MELAEQLETLPQYSREFVHFYLYEVLPESWLCLLETKALFYHAQAYYTLAKALIGISLEGFISNDDGVYRLDTSLNDSHVWRPETTAAKLSEFGVNFLLYY
ncbi:unnamed protein product [Protopolystoma xenopodis]|uniref:Uncharacterized protein n=1 Tax=Protopolystoma xenopodis TaxID=117903 RepID=A0A3S5BGU1_9PLAT|nr:unnamed protein product [Protopolystoma xenopodis]